MAHGIGISITERLSAAVVIDHAVVGRTVHHPDDDGIEADSLHGVPAEFILQQVVELLGKLDLQHKPTHIGVGMPGIVRERRGRRFAELDAVQGSEHPDSAHGCPFNSSS